MTLEEQRAHYSTVRARIANAEQRPTPERPAPRIIIVNHDLPSPAREPVPVRIKPAWFSVASPDRFRALVAGVCAAHGIEMSTVISKTRRQRIVRVRQEIAYHAIRFGWGYAQVGRWMAKDHSTVIHSARRMEKMIDGGEYELRFVPTYAEATRSEERAAGDGADDREDVLCTNGDEGCADHVPMRGGAGVCQRSNQAMG